MAEYRRFSDYERVSKLSEDEQRTLMRLIGDEGVEYLKGAWPIHARPEQLPPPGDWTIWLILAGRGFGKTRSGAEWVRSIAETDPMARIALTCRKRLYCSGWRGL